MLVEVPLYFIQDILSSPRPKARNSGNRVKTDPSLMNFGTSKRHEKNISPLHLNFARISSSAPLVRIWIPVSVGRTICVTPLASFSSFLCCAFRPLLQSFPLGRPVPEVDPSIVKTLQFRRFPEMMRIPCGFLCTIYVSREVSLSFGMHEVQRFT